MYVESAMCIGAGSLLIGSGYYLRPAKRFEASIKNLQGANAKLLQEKYSKAAADYDYIRCTIKNVKHPAIKANLITLQNISTNMLAYLGRNPEKIPLADKFINYYQDRTASLLKQYIELEASELQTPDIEKMKADLLCTLDGFQTAYKEQFAYLMESHLLDMNAELKVAQEVIKEDTINIKGDNHNDFNYTNSKNDFPNNSAQTKYYNVIVTGEEKNNLSTFQKLKLGMFYKDRFNPTYDISNMKKYRYISSAASFLLGSIGFEYLLLGKPIKALLCFIFSFTYIPTIIGFIKGINFIRMDDEEFYVDFYLPKFEK